MTPAAAPTKTQNWLDIEQAETAPSEVCRELVEFVYDPSSLPRLYSPAGLQWNLKALDSTASQFDDLHGAFLSTELDQPTHFKRVLADSALENLQRVLRSFNPVLNVQPRTLRVDIPPEVSRDVQVNMPRIIWKMSDPHSANTDGSTQERVPVGYNLRNDRAPSLPRKLVLHGANEEDRILEDESPRFQPKSLKRLRETNFQRGPEWRV